MISLNHVLTGTAISLAVRQPVLAAPIAFVSHFVLDAMPHYIYGTWATKRFYYTWAIDAVLSVAALAAVALSAPHLAWVVLAGGVSGELPDVLWVYYYLAGQPRYWFFRFHKRIQWSQTERGLWYELGYLAVLVVVNIALVRQHG